MTLAKRLPVSDRLRVLMSGVEAGWLRQHQGAVTLTYDESYLNTPGATPLSVSLPLIGKVHSGVGLRRWLANLLPDNDRVLERWAQRFQASAGSPYSLLAHVGADCAGAVQFVPEDRLATLQGGGLRPLTPAQVGRRLAELSTDPAAWTPDHEGGQFSLAGAQAKIALRYDGRRWSEPWGREATSHILKPPMPGLVHQELNEHLCLRLARELGLPAAESELRTLGGQSVIVVRRYDRLDLPGGVTRLHQEDLCQALGVAPTSKYQTQGGPTPAQVVALLRRVMRPAVAVTAIGTFLDALILSWVLAATDAHAKNYSLLLSAGEVRLAPLYDINSVLPYLTAARRGVEPGQISAHTAALAMSIGGRSQLLDIDAAAWKRLAVDCGLPPAATLTRVGELVEAVPAAISAVVASVVASKALTVEQRTFAFDLEQRVLTRTGLCHSALLGRLPPSRRTRAT